MLCVQPQPDSCVDFLKDFDATFNKPASGEKGPASRPDSPARRGSSVEDDPVYEQISPNLPRFFGTERPGLVGGSSGYVSMQQIYKNVFVQLSGEDASNVRAGAFGRAVLCKEWSFCIESDSYHMHHDKVYIVVDTGPGDKENNQSSAEKILKHVKNGIVIFVYVVSASCGRDRFPESEWSYTHTYVKKNGAVTLVKQDHNDLANFIAEKLKPWITCKNISFLEILEVGEILPLFLCFSAHFWNLRIILDIFTNKLSNNSS